MLRYFHVSTMSWTGGRCYAELGGAADDYVKIAKDFGTSVSCVEIYDHAQRRPGENLYAPQHLLFVDEWADDIRQQIANSARHRVERALAVFLAVGGAA
jgi:hypothetical protein